SLVRLLAKKLKHHVVNSSVRTTLSLNLQVLQTDASRHLLRHLVNIAVKLEDIDHLDVAVLNLSGRQLNSFRHSFSFKMQSLLQDPSRLYRAWVGQPFQPPDPIVSLNLVDVLERRGVGVHVVAGELNREEGLVFLGVLLTDTGDRQNSAGDNAPTQRVRGDAVENEGDVGRLASRGVHLRVESLPTRTRGHRTAVVGDNEVLQGRLREGGVDLELPLGQATLNDVNNLVNLHLGVVLLQLQGHTAAGAAKVGPVTGNSGVVQRLGDVNVVRLSGGPEFALVERPRTHNQVSHGHSHGFYSLSVVSAVSPGASDSFSGSGAEPETLRPVFRDRG